MSAKGEPTMPMTERAKKINRHLGEGPYTVTPPSPEVSIPMWHVHGPEGIGDCGTPDEASAYRTARLGGWPA